MLAPTELSAFPKEVVRAKTSRLWQWPFDLAQYEHNPVLSVEEHSELDAFVAHHDAGVRAWRKTTYVLLGRLLLPLNEVLNFSGADDYNRLEVLNILLRDLKTIKRSKYWQRRCPQTIFQDPAFARFGFLRLPLQF